MIELDKLKLMAQGGQADIYELDSNKIIRVLRNKNDEEALKIEMSVMKSLHDRGKSVPEVYEFLKVEEKPSIIMEKINGSTMIDELRKNPLKIFKQAEKLAELHMEVADCADGLEMVSINERAAHLIPKGKLLDSELKEFVLNILKGLPKGNDICHGDFHPGNIMIVNRKYYVIDWFGATIGRKLSDIAHTYLLLKNTPEIPNMPKLQNFLLGCTGSLIAGRYLSTCYKIENFQWDEFSKWMVVRAAERVFYGLPSEKEGLLKFIKKCKEAEASGINASKWWKFV